MNLKDVKVHEDNEDHFVASHGGGTPFRVAKKGLDKLTVAKIQMHHAMQHLSDGGTAVSAPTEEALEASNKKSPSEEALNTAVDPFATKGMDTVPGPVAWTPPGFVTPAQTGMMSGTPLSQKNDGPVAASAPLSPELQAEVQQGRDMSKNSQDSSILTPEAEKATAAMAGAATPETAAPLASKPAPIPSGPNIGGDIKAGNDMEQKAALARAATAQSEGNAMLAIQQESQNRRAQAAQEWDAKMKDNMAKTDAMTQDISNGKVDPDHWVNSLSTGQKIGSAMAMILGGLSQGLTHSGHNPALDIINSQIERDVDAQKTNLSRKDSLVRLYMEQGHGIQQAKQLAMADASDSAAAKLQMLNSKMMGEKAATTAQEEIGALKQKGALLRQTAFKDGLDNKLKAMDVMEKQRELQLRPQVQAANLAASSGKSLPAQYRALLDPERTVAVGNGRVAYANRKEDTKDITDTQQALASGLAATKRMRDLAGTTGLGGTDTQKGQLAVQDVLNAYQAIQGRSNAPRGKQEEELESALSNPTSIWKSKKSINEQMDTMEQVLRKHAAAVYGTRLVGGLKAAAGTD